MNKNTFRSIFFTSLAVSACTSGYAQSKKTMNVTAQQVSVYDTTKSVKAIPAISDGRSASANEKRWEVTGYKLLEPDTTVTLRAIIVPNEVKEKNKTRGKKLPKTERK